jgi:putative ABC transport system ATP-binding protein
MTQAVNLGDRILMMHKGRLLHDIAGCERQRITAGDLLERFEEAGRREVESEAKD